MSRLVTEVDVVAASEQIAHARDTGDHECQAVHPPDGPPAVGSGGIRRRESKPRLSRQRELEGQAVLHRPLPEHELRDVLAGPAGQDGERERARRSRSSLWVPARCPDAPGNPDEQYGQRVDVLI